MHLVVTAYCFSILACMYRGETATSSLNWSRGIFFFFSLMMIPWRICHTMGSWSVFLLSDFLNVLSDSQVVQKTSDKEYIWTVSLLHEFLNVLSDCQVLKKILVKEYNWMVSLLCELLCEFWAVLNPWRIYPTMNTWSVSLNELMLQNVWCRKRLGALRTKTKILSEINMSKKSIIKNVRTK
jgi:hypothetical protein